MFDSEITSLSALEKTNTVRVPHPIGLVEGSHNTYFCILEFVKIHELDKFTVKLGENLAKLHLHNENIAKGTNNYISQFGFPVTTCIGLLPANNTWCDNWAVSIFHIGTVYFTNYSMVVVYNFFVICFRRFISTG